MKSKIEESKAMSIIEEHDAKSQRTTDDSMFVMGVMLSIFSPLSFIAGVYGMNFIQPDGNPGMPELQWYGADTPPEAPGGSVSLITGITGYQYFWILCGVAIAAVILLYWAMGLITLEQPIKFLKFFLGKATCGRVAIEGRQERKQVKSEAVSI
jgi:hypothetical protein